jgi:phage repressor protein C with HTH and peptisase S24 domain|nr:MAG TPA: Repressor protein CI [Caudoviricetes sp.]
MQYSKLIDTLQKLIPDKKIDHIFIGELLGADTKKMWARKNQNYNFKEDELAKIESRLNISLNSNDCISLPVRGEVTASMGYGVTVYDESQTGTYDISSRLLQDLGVNKNTSEIIFGTGNSMEPTIQGGDALLIDLSRKEINDGKVYCIRYEGQLLTKRLQKLSSTKVKIISDNKDYEPIILDLDKENYIDFSVIGEIRWCGRIFL